MIFGSSMLILNAAQSTPQWRAFMAYEIERNRALYSFADTGIAMLPPRSARCVGTARVLYAQILDQIERRRLRRVLRPSPGAHLAQGRYRRPHHGDRSAERCKRQAEAYQRRSIADVTQDTY